MSFKQMKTAKLGIALQLTEISSDRSKNHRLWEVHDVERNRGFRVTLTDHTLDETPSGEPPRKGAWSADEIRGAIGLAVERFLTSSPELVAGPLYEVQVVSRDLYEFAGLSR
jgi:hypothetical protein